MSQFVLSSHSLYFTVHVLILLYLRATVNKTLVDVKVLFLGLNLFLGPLHILASSCDSYPLFLNCFSKTKYNKNWYVHLKEGIVRKNTWRKKNTFCIWLLFSILNCKLLANSFTYIIHKWDHEVSAGWVTDELKYPHIFKIHLASVNLPSGQSMCDQF